MKKVFLSLAVVCSVALVSCGGNKAEKAEAEDSVQEVVADVAVVEDTIAPDSVQADTVVAVAAEEAPAEAGK